MKFALIGADDTTPALARALHADPRHELVVAVDLPITLASEPWAVGLATTSNWESLLDSQIADAVVIATGPDEELRAEQLRRFVQQAIPVLAAHPVISSVLVYYELDMISQETHGVIVPYLPWRDHPVVGNLRELVSQGGISEIGKLEQLHFDRSLADRSKATVTAQFARDVDLLRAICGEIRQMSAMRSIDAATAYQNLSLEMACDAGIVIRWSVAPGSGEPTGRLTLVGSTGKSILDIRGDGARWKLELVSPHGSRQEPMPSWDAAKAALMHFESSAAGATVAPNWSDATRSLELTDAIDRCLKRGRTIDLSIEDRSEAAAFKGTMAALGCALLIIAPIILLAVALGDQIAQIFGLPALPLNFKQQWPFLVLLVMALFLVLQWLLKLALPRSDSADRSKEISTQ